MKNRALQLALIVALTLAATPGAARAADSYKVDPAHSFALFKVGHLGVSFVHGSFTGISGKIIYDKKDIKGNFVEIVVGVDSVNTNNADRDAHLKRDDFFHAEKYPTMSFKSKRFKKLEGEKYEVTGDFTLHGVTKTITVIAEVTGEGKDPWGGVRAGFETAFTIKRSDYGMDKNIPAAGDKVWVTLNVEGIREQAK